MNIHNIYSQKHAQSANLSDYGGLQHYQMTTESLTGRVWHSPYSFTGG